MPEQQAYSAYAIPNLLTSESGAGISPDQHQDASQRFSYLYDAAAGSRISVNIPSGEGRIDFDFGAPGIEPTDVFLINHDKDSSVGVEILAEGSSPPTGSMGSFVHRARDMRLTVEPGGALRYWAMKATEASPPTAFDLGELVFATTVRLPFSFKGVGSDVFRYPGRTRVVGPSIETSLGLRKFVSVYEERVFELVTELMAESQFTAFQAFYDLIKYGDPFVFIPDDVSEPEVCYWVSIDERSMEPEDVQDSDYRVGLILREQPSGIRIPLTSQ